MIWITEQIIQIIYYNKAFDTEIYGPNQGWVEYHFPRVNHFSFKKYANKSLISDVKRKKNLPEVQKLNIGRIENYHFLIRLFNFT